MAENMTVIKTDTGDIKLSPSIIKNYLVRGNGNVTDQETMMFLSLCKFQKLNPFLNEAYLIKFNNAPASLVVGKETFTKRAFTHPKFRGLTAGVIVERNGELMELEGTFKKPSDILLGGWAIVHVENRVPFKNTVSLAEFQKTKSDGTLQSTWKSMPCTMIRKVALVQALREAFPDYFQAMYSQEEMPVDNDLINEFKEVEIPDECVIEEVKKITPDQVKRLYTIATKHGIGKDEVKRLIVENYNLGSSKELNIQQYETLINFLENLPVDMKVVEEAKEDKK